MAVRLSIIVVNPYRGNASLQAKKQVNALFLNLGQFEGSRTRPELIQDLAGSLENGGIGVAIFP